uniref:Uncharacterized protein n=1 Tax=Anguilla anguilla TaxID=7936 RepID=A0A0E9TIE3_ANGAN
MIILGLRDEYMKISEKHPGTCRHHERRQSGLLIFNQIIQQN